MNLTLGSSCPTYQPLSVNRWPWPLTTLIGSTHRSPASFLTAVYLALQPLQSRPPPVKPGVEGVTVAVVSAAALAAPTVLAAAEPVRLSWATTAIPSTGTSSSHHRRHPPGGELLPDLAEDPRADQGVRMCDPSPPGAGRARDCPGIRDVPAESNNHGTRCVNALQVRYAFLNWMNHARACPHVKRPFCELETGFRARHNPRVPAAYAAGTRGRGRRADGYPQGLYGSVRWKSSYLYCAAGCPLTTVG